MLNIDPWNILFTVINLLVFFLLLKKFLFKPVTKIMQQREDMIQKDLDDAKAEREQAAAIKEDIDKKLAAADSDADAIIATAKKRADKQSADIIAEAENQAQELLNDARKTIEREREEAVEAAREEIADLAVMAASQVLKKNIDSDSNRKFAKQILAEVGADND